MKVLIVDKLSPETVTALEKLNLQVEVRSDLTAETLPGAVRHERCTLAVVWPPLTI